MHAKFVGYCSVARSCLQKRAIRSKLNQGILTLESARLCKVFIGICAALRLWKRELDTGADAEAIVKNSRAKCKT